MGPILRNVMGDTVDLSVNIFIFSLLGVMIMTSSVNTSSSLYRENNFCPHVPPPPCGDINLLFSSVEEIMCSDDEEDDGFVMSLRDTVRNKHLFPSSPVSFSDEKAVETNLMRIFLRD